MRSIRVIMALSLTAGLASAADVSVHGHFGLMGSYDVEETQYFTAGKVVMESPRVRTIVDLDAKTVTSVFRNDKFYTVKSFDDLQREETEARATGTPSSSAITLKPTGKTLKVAGHQAKEYTFTSDRLSGTVWVAQDIPLPAEAVKWGRVAWASGDRCPDEAFQDALAGLKALPLLAGVSKPLGPAEWTTAIEVTEVGNQAPPAELLKVPEGYVRRTRPRGAPPAEP